MESSVGMWPPSEDNMDGDLESAGHNVLIRTYANSSGPIGIKVVIESASVRCLFTVESMAGLIILVIGGK